MTLSGTANNHSPTIMFVDDDLHLREALKRCLRSEPFNILLASSGEEALGILDVQRDTVDVVVSDENMPGGMSGTDLFVRMRTQYPHIIRIMLTGHVNSRVAISAINEGRIFKFIPKPVDSAELIFSIRYALTQQQAQRDLERSEERFRMLSEATFEGVALTADGVIEDMNRQFTDMFGYTPSELAGLELAGLAAPEFRDAVIGHIRSNCVESCEFIGVKKDGSGFPLEARHKALARGGRTLHLTVIRDLTERKRAEEALINAKNRAEKANELKDRFVSMVSHNLRAPLASMMTGIQTFCGEREDIRAEGLARLDNALQTGERAIAMIDELLHYTRLRSGELILNRRFMDAHAVAVMAKLALAHLAEKKGINIVNTAPKGTRIYADPTLFADVIQNLVSNAIKFTRHGGTITISARNGWDAVVVTVHDTGIGVNDRLAADLFRHDVVTSTPGTDGELGTGLGLPSCHDIMKAHGGALAVESRVGEGSVFFASLPAIQPRVMVWEPRPGAAREYADVLLARGICMSSADSDDGIAPVLSHEPPHLFIIHCDTPEEEEGALDSRSALAAASAGVPVMIMSPRSPHAGRVTGLPLREGGVAPVFRGHEDLLLAVKGLLL